MGSLHQLPGVVLDDQPRHPQTLNLSEQEVVDAAGGYVRPADQLRELHARGFTRAWITTVGRKRVILERAHYEAVQAGTYGAARPAPEAVPVQRVSGLHVQNNLQILTGSENSKKRNRFEVEE